MAALVVLAFVVGVAVGGCVEAWRHQCGDVERWHRSATAWARCAGRWRHEALRWQATAEGHAEVLAALGRSVAEGGTVVDPDGRHPSVRRREEGR